MRVRSPWPVHVGVGLAAGAGIMSVDNFAFQGEISPVVIVAMLFAATGAAALFWGWRGWVTAFVTWACVPTAHLGKHLLALPDTLHPNTYASILKLAAFSLVVATAGFGFGVLLRRRTAGPAGVSSGNVSGSEGA